jgi:hypothetical protein
MATSDPYRADHLPLVGADILKLPTLQLQKIALTRIAQLTSGEIRGRPLKELPSWPKELGACFKLYFDEQEQEFGLGSGRRRPPRYRVVYRFLPPAAKGGSPDRRPRIQVLAVAKRAHSEVYERAADRLALPDVAQERAIQPRPVPPSAQQAQQQGLQQQQRPPGLQR